MENYSVKMAAFASNEVMIENDEGLSEQLTNRQYVQLKSIALGYLNIDLMIIKSKQFEHRGNSEAFNRDILKRWANRNPGPCQVQVRDIFEIFCLEHTSMTNNMKSVLKCIASPNLIQTHVRKCLIWYKM